MYEGSDTPQATIEAGGYAEDTAPNAEESGQQQVPWTIASDNDTAKTSQVENLDSEMFTGNAISEGSFHQATVYSQMTGGSSMNTQDMAAHGIHSAEGIQAGETNGHTEDKQDRLSFFLGGLNPDITKSELLDYLATFVPVEDVDIKMDVSTGRNRGYAFISIRRGAPLDVETFLSTKHIIHDKQVDVRELGRKPSLERPPPERPPERRMSSTNANRHKIFIGGITSSVTDETLHNHFEQFGPIEKANVIRDGAGKSRGFGFVQFTSIESVGAAVEASPHQLDADNKVDAQPAQDRGARRGPSRYPAVASPYGASYDSSQGYCYGAGQGYGYAAGPYGYHAAAYSPMFSSPYGPYAQASGYPQQYAAYGGQAYAAETYGSTAESIAYGAVRRGDGNYVYPSGTTRSSRGAPY